MGQVSDWIADIQAELGIGGDAVADVVTIATHREVSHEDALRLLLENGGKLEGLAPVPVRPVVPADPPVDRAS